MIIKRLKGIARRMLRPPLHRAEVALDYVFIGTEYGGWPLLKTTPKNALVYSFGIGEDLSFDIGAIETFQCVVHGFDPTPRCKQWIDRQSLPEKFTFHPIGIADHDGTAKFFPPQCDEHVSFSVQPAEGVKKEAFVTAEVLRLQTIIDNLKTENPQVVKMDIEGFEYGVIEDLLKREIRPEQLLVEFHHGMYGISNARTEATVEQLRACGYKCFFVSSGGHEYGFVLDERVESKI